jgi:hypothetical protein
MSGSDLLGAHDNPHEFLIVVCMSPCDGGANSACRERDEGSREELQERGWRKYRDLTGDQPVCPACARKDGLR